MVIDIYRKETRLKEDHAEELTDKTVEKEMLKIRKVNKDST